ncbi:MAG: zinc ribbon domain-containing protein [Bacilli bacterium]|nr:zinc ribbon domain-containing protein [Bacilli bacterium]
MKKTLKKLYFILLFLLMFDNTYALTLDIDQATVLYFIFGLFIIIGLIIIVISKIGNRGNTRSYENEMDEDDHEIEGLVNQEKIDRNFNPDSIFKELPTFSNKKFFEDTEKELTKILQKKQSDIIDVDATNHKIINFETNENNYIITSHFKVKIKIKPQDETIEKSEEIKYLVISEKSKEIKVTDINHTKCPTCGAKIKDNTKTKCLKCGSKLEKKKVHKNDWSIKETKKMD